MARTAVRPAAKPTSDEALFDAWFARHRDELRSYSIRLTGDAATAEDVVQETFARAWCNLPQLREREEIGPWLYRVARNLCVDTHRARRRVVTSDDLPAWAEESDGAEASDPLRNIERAEECAAVREALGALSDRHRDVLYLRDIVGMAYDEVGERHGVSGESARAVLARARRRLREELKTMGNGIFGAAIWLRLRVDGVLRRAGGDRIPVEPLTAAVAQYLTVVAAAVGMAFGPMVVGADADGASGAPSEAGAQSGVVSADSPGGPADGARDGAPTSDVPDGPATPEKPSSPRVVVEAGPDQGLPTNPYNPNGSGNWVEGTLLQINPEHAPAGTGPVISGAASAACAAQPELCPTPEG